jgi:hypothetical protein
MKKTATSNHQEEEAKKLMEDDILVQNQAGNTNVIRGHSGVLQLEACPKPLAGP